MLALNTTTGSLIINEHDQRENSQNFSKIYGDAFDRLEQKSTGEDDQLFIVSWDYLNEVAYSSGIKIVQCTTEKIMEGCKAYFNILGRYGWMSVDKKTLSCKFEWDKDNIGISNGTLILSEHDQRDDPKVLSSIYYNAEQRLSDKSSGEDDKLFIVGWDYVEGDNYASGIKVNHSTFEKTQEGCKVHFTILGLSGWMYVSQQDCSCKFEWDK